jgi:hypothetical protein
VREYLAEQVAEILGVQPDAEFLAPEPSLSFQAMQPGFPLLCAWVLVRPDNLELRSLLVIAKPNLASDFETARQANQASATAADVQGASDLVDPLVVRIVPGNVNGQEAGVPCVAVFLFEA